LQRFLQSKGLGSAQSADLCQEAFIRLWKNCSKVTAEKTKSFLFTVANNLVIDEFRKAKTQLKLRAAQLGKVENKDGQYHMELEEFKEKLEAAINSMSPASKEVFLLHRFSDMTYKEIAKQLEISQKAVEKRMTKALKHLAEQKILKRK